MVIGRAASGGQLPKCGLFAEPSLKNKLLIYKRIRMLLVHTKLVHTRMTTVELLAYDNAPECA